MRTEAYWIAGKWPGRLGIVPRPRGGDWLEDELRAWRASGVDIVVSLLTPDEIREFDLEAEAALSRKHGIQFRPFPIPDRGVPSSLEAIADLVADLARTLLAGKSVVIHCRQSIGRSALLAALLLASSGEDPDQAFSAIEEARGRPVPDTAEQHAWVKTSAARLRTRNRVPQERPGSERHGPTRESRLAPAVGSGKAQAAAPPKAGPVNRSGSARASSRGRG